MLVLTRKESEQIVIGKELVITIVRVEGGKVRIGVDAPREVPVMRREVLRRPNDRPPVPEAA